MTQDVKSSPPHGHPTWELKSSGSEKRDWELGVKGRLGWVWGKPGPTPLPSFPYSPHWPAGQNFQRDRRQREVGQGGEFFPDVSVCGLAAVGLSFSPCTPTLAEGDGERGTYRSPTWLWWALSLCPPGSSAAWWCLEERQGKKGVDSGRQREARQRLGVDAGRQTG